LRSTRRRVVLGKRLVRLYRSRDFKKLEEIMSYKGGKRIGSLKMNDGLMRRGSKLLVSG